MKTPEQIGDKLAAEYDVFIETKVDLANIIAQGIHADRAQRDEIPERVYTPESGKLVPRTFLFEALRAIGDEAPYTKAGELEVTYRAQRAVGEGCALQEPHLEVVLDTEDMYVELNYCSDDLTIDMFSTSSFATETLLSAVRQGLI